MASIQVEGNGRAVAPPDQVTLTFEITVTDPDYISAVSQLDQRVSALKDGLACEKLLREDIKTTGFHVTAETEYRDGVSEQRGFSARHQLTAVIPFQRQLLNALMCAAMESRSGAEILLEFGVSDDSELKVVALESAVVAATKSADVLARASGKRLGGIIDIAYGAGARLASGGLDATLAPAQVDFCQIQLTDEVSPTNVVFEASVICRWGLDEK